MRQFAAKLRPNPKVQTWTALKLLFFVLPSLCANLLFGNDTIEGLSFLVSASITYFITQTNSNCHSTNKLTHFGFIVNVWFSRIKNDMLAICRLLDICEGIYAARAEGELEVEEVLYWTLVNIYRSPHMLLEYTKPD